MPYYYYVIPAVTALIGWLTNVVAVKMLFHPRRPILGFQGAIPKRHDQLARSIADLFEQELLSNNELAAHLESLDIEKPVEGLLDERLFAAVNGFKEQIPMASMFLNDAMTEKISGKLKREVVKMLPELKAKLSAQVADKLDLRELVEDKILSFSVRKLEKIVMRVATRELHAIEVLGGVLGLIIGIVQVLIMALVS